MSSFIPRPRYTRLLWTVLVTFYFLVFFVNFFRNAAPATGLLPTALAVALVGWLALEYYFGSPFFQSGLGEPHALLRGAFAFFVYPYFGYLAADYIWWNRTQLPVPAAMSGPVGLALFGIGVYLRLVTLLGYLRALQPAGVTASRGRGQAGPQTFERRLVALREQRISRHPRYLATFIQLVGAALVFRSWGGLVLVAGIGLPLILLQARSEDRYLSSTLKSEFADYAGSVPFFWPLLRRVR
jgi:protein-S-isoprenylcysteine O-methyltransferase Ste14